MSDCSVRDTGVATGDEVVRIHVGRSLETTAMETLSTHLQKLAPLTDEQVVVRILDGDTGAFELLMRRHNQRLYRLARSVVRVDADAEDVVQEAYVRAYGALAKFEHRSTVASWLSRIVFHEALRFRRKQMRVGLLDGSGLARHAGASAQDPMPSHIERAEVRSLLTGALDSLPALPRAVVVLRLVEGLSTCDTAESLRMTQSNVKVTLHRAKRELAETLQEQSADELREHFAFAGDQCDRIVAGVFDRIGAARHSRSHRGAVPSPSRNG